MRCAAQILVSLSWVSACIPATDGTVSLGSNDASVSADRGGSHDDHLPDANILGPDSDAGPSRTSVEFRPGVLDFGTISVGCSGRAELALVNEGPEPVEIDEVALLPLDVMMTIVRYPTLPLVLDGTTRAVFEVEFRAPDEGPSPVFRIEARSHGEVVASASLLGTAAYGRRWTIEQHGDGSAAILVLIDSSGSMEEAFAELAHHFSDFLAHASMLPNTYRVGLTSMDVGSGLDGTLVGRAIDPSSSHAQAEWESQLNLIRMSGGDTPGMGLEASVRALTVRNQNFVQDLATIGVIYVSDEDDVSPDTVENYVAALRAARPAARIIANAIVGPASGSCIDSGSAARGLRYVDAVGRTGGIAASICDPATWSFAFGFDLGTPLASSFDLEATIAHPEAIAVTVDGQEMEAYDSTTQAFRWQMDGSVLRFESGFVPPAGSTIDVSYYPGCAGE